MAHIGNFVFIKLLTWRDLVKSVTKLGMNKSAEGLKSWRSLLKWAGRTNHLTRAFAGNRRAEFMMKTSSELT